MTSWCSLRPGADVGDADAPPRAGKIALVSQHYAPFPSTISAYMMEIVEELARRHQVMVITSAPGSASK
jgi:hypothetical protein